jgi:hypothetical protein
MDKWHSKDEHAKRMGASKAQANLLVIKRGNGKNICKFIDYLRVRMCTYMYIIYIYVCVCTHAHAHTFIDSSNEFEEPQILISLENVGMVTKRYKKPISSGC